MTISEEEVEAAALTEETLKGKLEQIVDKLDYVPDEADWVPLSAAIELAQFAVQSALESLAPVTMTEGQISAAYHRFVTGDEATQHERFRAALVALPNMADGVREILQTIVDEMEGCRDGKCDDHAVRFGHDALVAAQSALAAAPPPTSQWQTTEAEQSLIRAAIAWRKLHGPATRLTSSAMTDVAKYAEAVIAEQNRVANAGRDFTPQTNLPAPPTEQDKP